MHVSRSRPTAAALFSVMSRSVNDRLAPRVPAMSTPREVTICRLLAPRFTAPGPETSSSEIPVAAPLTPMLSKFRPDAPMVTVSRNSAVPVVVVMLSVPPLAATETVLPATPRASKPVPDVVVMLRPPEKANEPVASSSSISTPAPVVVSMSTLMMETVASALTLEMPMPSASMVDWVVVLPIVIVPPVLAAMSMPLAVGFVAAPM